MLRAPSFPTGRRLLLTVLLARSPRVQFTSFSFFVALKIGGNDIKNLLTAQL